MLAFIKLLPKFVENLDINGLRFVKTNFTQEVIIHDKNYNVPVFRIINPKNIPFSYNSLIWIIIDRLRELNKLTSAKLTDGDIKNIFVIDDFSVNDFYIPVKILKNFENCVDGREGSFSFISKENYQYWVEFEFVVDSRFELHWYSSDEFQIKVSISIKKIVVKKIDTDEEVFFFKNEITRKIRNIILDYPEFVETPIWDCITDNITEYQTFIDGDWQYVYINFDII